MGTITTADSTEIFYKDWGSGQPIVFSHGWPLSGRRRARRWRWPRGELTSSVRDLRRRS
jgi:pimeloyl-ACP methyl ester carboxylesterase